MTTALIGWILLFTMATVIVIAIVVSAMIYPRAIFRPPPLPKKPPPRRPDAVDLKEVRRGHWK